MELDYDRLVVLRKQSVAWRLLTAGNAALMLSFFNKACVEQGARSIAGTELVERLDDELFALNERLGQGTFPKSAKAYLDDWSSPENGWLRKYYPPDSDEPHYDATAAVEKAISWVRSLEERSFVGTESRLNAIFDPLRQMTFGAETDPEARLAELTRRRREVDQEIQRVEAGEVDVLDSAATRDRHQQVTATAHGAGTHVRARDAGDRGGGEQRVDQAAETASASGRGLAPASGGTLSGRSRSADGPAFLSHLQTVSTSTKMDV
jgi:hypothetical protein